MTNGEKLDQVFPDGIYPFSKKWLDCEYKERSLSSALEKNSQKLENSTTKNDLGVDCILRKSVIDELKRYFHDEYYQRTSIQDCRDCFIEDVLKHLPSVTPIRPKGHWIKQNDDYYDWYECSECGYGSEGEMQYSSEHDVRTSYCPNCGADNREVEE